MKWFVCLYLLIAGCAHISDQKSWTRADMTEQQFKQDAYECERLANIGTSTAQVGIVPTWKAHFEICMEGRGYRLANR